VAQAFDLFHPCKVKHFGVSNFTTNQFDLLQSRLDAPLINLISGVVSFGVANTLKTGHWIMCNNSGDTNAWSAFCGGATFFQHGMKKPSVFK